MLPPSEVPPPLSNALRYSSATDFRCSSVMVFVVSAILVPPWPATVADPAALRQMNGRTPGPPGVEDRRLGGALDDEVRDAAGRRGVVGRRGDQLLARRDQHGLAAPLDHRARAHHTPRGRRPQ